CGADDIHGTAFSEKVFGSGWNFDAQRRQDEIMTTIASAGFDPVERDVLYRPAVRGGGTSGGR
ncbi:MAG: aminofutalosine synthase MqnE, partial [Planctomycetota bacterium]|nr:aminofutalosine synthase MqnE [Planctomycetota bacterium]